MLLEYFRNRYVLPGRDLNEQRTEQYVPGMIDLQFDIPSSLSPLDISHHFFPPLFKFFQFTQPQHPPLSSIPSIFSISLPFKVHDINTQQTPLCIPLLSYSNSPSRNNGRRKARRRKQRQIQHHHDLPPPLQTRKSTAPPLFNRPILTLS